MDGRGWLMRGMFLLIAVVGCQTQVMDVPNSAATSSASNWSIFETNEVKKTPRPKDPPPSVLVSYGDFEAGEAFSARSGPDRRQLLCDSARADYEKALMLNPKCVAAYQGLARLYTTMHDLPLAVETYQKALKLASSNASLWFELGVCHNYQKNFSPALECLERAAQLDPGNRSYVNARGVVLAEAGRYDDSLKWFVHSNGEAMGYYRLAQTLRHLQQPELSRRCLEVAVQKDPNLAPPLQLAAYQPIQQTAYQSEADPEPTAPPEQVAPATNQTSPQVLLPPVPLISDE